MSEERLNVNLTPEPQSSKEEKGELTPVDLPGKQDSEGWRKLHPLTPLLRGGLFIVVIIGFVVAGLRDQLLNLFFGRFGWSPNVDVDIDGSTGSDDDWEFNIEETSGGLIDEDYTWLIVLGTTFAILLVIGVGLWLDWQMKTFRVTDEAVESRSGILFKRHRRAPLDRVQGINLQRPLLARLVGVTMLEISTAGSDGKVSLMYLSHREAKEVRAIIMHRVGLRRSKRDAASTATPQSTPSTTAHSDVAPTGVRPDHPAPAQSAHDSQTLAEKIKGQAQVRMSDIADLDVDPQTEAGPSLVTIPVRRLLGSTVLSWEVLVPFFMLVASVVVGIVWQAGVFFAVLPLVLVTFGTWFSSFTKGMNFHLTRSEQGVRVASGLLATVTDTIPMGRIHAIEVRQPLFWRAMGWWQVRITTAGVKLTEAGQSGSKNVMLPVGKIADAHTVVHVLLPEHGLSDTELDEALIGRDGDYVGSPKKASIVLLWGRRRNGLSVTRPVPGSLPTLRIRKGALTRRLVCVPLERFQSVELGRGLLHRPFGLASLQGHTVLGPVVAKISGLDLTQARTLFDEIRSAVLDVQLERVAALEYPDDRTATGDATPKRGASDQTSPGDVDEPEVPQ